MTRGGEEGERGTMLSNGKYNLYDNRRPVTHP